MPRNVSALRYFSALQCVSGLRGFDWLRCFGVLLAARTASGCAAAGAGPGTLQQPNGSASASVGLVRPGRIPPAAARPAGMPIVHARWTSCAAAYSSDVAAISPYRLPLYDLSFPVASVFMCTNPDLASADRDVVASENRSENVRPLLAALQLPDVPPATDDGICPANAVIAPWLILVDGVGRWIRPGLPADVVCAKPRPEVFAALQQLHLAPVPTMGRSRHQQSGASRAWRGRWDRAS